MYPDILASSVIHIKFQVQKIACVFVSTVVMMVILVLFWPCYF